VNRYGHQDSLVAQIPELQGGKLQQVSVVIWAKDMKNFALLPASPQIREWCSILEQEMMRWPGVRMGHIFGTRAFYHRKVMFAMLPDNRSLESATAISFITSAKKEEKNWQTFELKDRNLIVTALTSLKNAYMDSMLLS
jgi:hypothetical protein